MDTGSFRWARQLALAFVISVPVHAATVTWTNLTGGDWHVGANWSTGSPPAPGDDVEIAAPGTYVVTITASSVSINNLILGSFGGQGAQTLQTSPGRDLTISGSAIIESDGTLTTFSNLVVDGSLVVDGELAWEGNDITGTGTTTIATDGLLDIVGSQYYTRIFNHTLVNDGTVQYQPGGWGFNIENSTVQNNGTFLLLGDEDVTFTWGTFNNAGTLIKTVGTSSRLFVNRFASAAAEEGYFHNTGVVEVQVGTIVYTSDLQGSNQSVLRVADGSAVVFESGTLDYDLDAGTTIEGAGDVTVTGRVNVNAPMAIPRLNLYGGDLKLFAPLTVTEHLDWTTGSVGGTSSLTIAQGATAVRQFNASPANIASSAAVRNLGSFEIFGHLSMNFDADFRNEGLLTMRDQSALGGSSGWGDLVNYGVLSTEGTVNLYTYFQDSRGAVEVTSGVLRLLHGAPASQAAGIWSLAGGNVEGSIEIRGGELRGAGLITGNVTNTGGRVSPGASAGILAISGDYAQGAEGLLLIELGGTTPGSGYDQLAVSGSATVAGSIDVRLIGGYEPSVSDTFDVLTYSSISGVFSPLSGATFLDQTYLANTLRLDGAGTSPTVSAVNPSSGATTGGTLVTIDGGGFVDGVRVRIGGAWAPGVLFVDGSTLMARTPAGASGQADVVVINPDTLSGTLSNGFTYECAGAATPTILSPPSGATLPSSSIVLEWAAADGNFRYDVYLDTSNPPATLVAHDLTPLPGSARGRFVASNLEPGTTYWWRVVARGDPACGTSTLESALASFSTESGCEAPEPFTRISPADGATGVEPTTTLSWQSAPGAAEYDLFFGPSDTPPLYLSTTDTSVEIADLEGGTTYYWAVIARSVCDPVNGTTLATASFSVAGACDTPAPFELATPADGASSVSISARLAWGESVGASSYDLLFGTVNPPPLFETGLTSRQVRVNGLERGQTYYWQVVASAECNGTESETAIRSFTTSSACSTPGVTTFDGAPAGSVGLRQTYSLQWRPVPDLGLDGYYELERSTVSDFSTILDRQMVRGNATSLVATTAGSVHHRVRAVPGCDATRAGQWSSPSIIEISDAPRNVIFTVLPDALVVPLGTDLSQVRGRVVVENLSAVPATVAIAQREIDSPPFFSIVAPANPDGELTLDPGVPVELGIELGGISTSSAGSYRGMIYLTGADGEPLPVVPVAMVSLTVGSGTWSVPEILIDGASSGSISFPPHAGDDSSRPPLEIAIHNPSSSPMSLAGEVGPELWLLPESGWSDTPLAAGETRNVNLFTDRTIAPAGSPLPRSTWFRVKTSRGRSDRILVRDYGVPSLSNDRTRLRPGEHSRIVPDVLSSMVPGGAIVSEIGLTNLATEAVTTELIFTPTGESGFSSSDVLSARVALPPHGGVTLTDPLVNLFGLSRPARGQIELRSPGGGLNRLQVRARHLLEGGRRETIARMPVLHSGDGARAGASYVIPGIVQGPDRATSVVLVETTGRDRTTVDLELFGSAGNSLGTASYTLERYGHIVIPGVVSALGGTVVNGGRIVISVTDGSGAVSGIARIFESLTGPSAVIAARPSVDPIAAAQARFRSASSGKGSVGADAEVTRTLAVPLVVQGAIDGASTEYYTTVVGFVAPADAAATFNTTFTSSAGTMLTRSISVAAGQTTEYTNVLGDFFTLSTDLMGTMSVETSSADAQIYSWLVAGSSQSGALPIPSTGGALTASASGSAHPLHYDGMSQTTDPSVGSRWNLLIQEMAGASGKVRISLYESSNRSSPVVQKDFPVTGGGLLSLETIFAATGLESELRKKDRSGVLCVVEPVEGDALVTATAVEIDNVTGAVQVHSLEPGTGLPTQLAEVQTIGGQGGDANGDGAVSVADIFFLINNLFAGGPAPIGSGDANGDGAVSVADIFFLINHLFAGGPAPV